jgi:phosphoserine phosphatase RsbU/P
MGRLAMAGARGGDSVAPPSTSEDRLEAIASIVDPAIGHLDVDDLLEELLGRVGSLLEADTAAVLLLDRSGKYLVARAAHGIEEEVRQGVRVAVGIGFAGRIAAERRPVMLDHVDATRVWNPILWRKGIQKMLGVPLLTGPTLLGVLHVGRLADRDFTADDAALLEVVGSRIAGAVQARELEVERAAARVVQRSLIPSDLPTCEGIEFATRYTPAEVGGVGGDWYDGFVLPSGDLWVMAGDVAGHGLASAVTMGRLRAALRAYALDGYGPSQVLARADRKFQFFDEGQTATALCALLTPPYETIELASAGHPPPVFAEPDTDAVLLEIPVSPPLGVTTLVPDTTTVPFPPGALFLAYTDGLVERRTESIDEGLERLRAVVRAEAPEVVCHEVMHALVGSHTPGDDIAVIAVRRSAPADGN